MSTQSFDAMRVVRVSRELFGQLKPVASDRSENMSTLIRRFILRDLAELSYLPIEQKKALSIAPSLPSSANQIKRSGVSLEEAPRGPPR
jgi:hypothetical protein